MIHVIWNENEAEALWQQGRDVHAPYLFEILKQAGYAHRVWTPAAWLQARPEGVTLVVGLDADASWPAAIADHCAGGNVVLAVGAAHGLEETLGLKQLVPLKEGWIDWAGSPLGEGLRSSFHFFGAAVVEPAADVESHGAIVPHNGPTTAYPAVTLRTIGSGAAGLLAVDVARTFCIIQQGVPVLKDGAPSPDGSALITDDILKADDGVVLHWERDREAVGDGAPFFLHPIVDEFRIVLMRLLHSLHERIARPLAHVWFWPEGLEAVGHISHDTDGNDVNSAHVMMDRIDEVGIKTSWCTIMPGYPEETYRRIVADGHEIALHYNALEQEGSRWDERLFNEQLEMLQGQMADIGQPTRIWTNKNHYLRWEGDVQFYKWCEKVGIVIEQSKGGTKQGNKGFVAGTSHMYLPISDAAERNRLMNVYSNPTLAWDPPIPVRCTTPEANAIIDRTIDVYGVAHFLCHPATFTMYDYVGAGFMELIRYGKQRGLVWWTAIELYNWYELRRTVETTVQDDKLVVTAGGACQGLTIVVAGDVEVPELPGTVRAVKPVERYGVQLQELIVDVPQGETVIPLGAKAAAGS